MTHVVSSTQPRTSRSMNAALEVGATVTAACLSLLMVLVPAGLVLLVVAIVPGIPQDVGARLFPLLAAALAIYACCFAVGLIMLSAGRAARRHGHA